MSDLLKQLPVTYHSSMFGKCKIKARTSSYKPSKQTLNKGNLVAEFDTEVKEHNHILILLK
jgi:hypothetical protein